MVIMVLAASMILAQSVLFVAIFYGISAIWKGDLGVLQRYLVSLPPLSVLVVGPCWWVFGRWRTFTGSRPGHRGTTLHPQSISASKAALRAAGGGKITRP